MVDAINPISATAGSEPTKVGTSTSIGSEEGLGEGGRKRSHPARGSDR